MAFPRPIRSARPVASISGATTNTRSQAKKTIRRIELNPAAIATTCAATARPKKMPPSTKNAVAARPRAGPSWPAGVPDFAVIGVDRFAIEPES